MRQGYIAVLGALAPVHVDHEAVSVEVRDLEKEPVVEAESEAIDRGEVHAVVQGCGPTEKAPHFLHTEDGGQAVFGLGSHAVESLPVSLQDVVEEESDGAVADTHGVWREPVNVFSMQEVVLELILGDEVW